MSVSLRVGLRALVAGVAGGIFGVGLAVAGMTDPVKVLNFLDILGDWDASLMLVLGGAVVLTFLGYRLILIRQQPVLADGFSLPKRKDIDQPLVWGAVCFGVGWGLAGYCPGPALASIGMGNAEALWFVPSMLAGMFLRRWIARMAKSSDARGVAQTRLSQEAASKSAAPAA